MSCSRISTTIGRWRREDPRDFLICQFVIVCFIVLISAGGRIRYSLTVSDDLIKPR